MDCVCRENDPCVFHWSQSAPKDHNVSEMIGMLEPFTKDDLDDLLKLYTNAGGPFAQNVIKNVLARLRVVPTSA